MTAVRTTSANESTNHEQPETFPFDTGWDLHEHVQVRPERFGALLYHYGDRRLSFVKSPELRTALELLAASPTARLALSNAGIPEAAHPAHGRALSTLATTNMIVQRQREDHTP